jgi:N-acetylmuramoyl-L-alanine amidase
MSSDLRWERQLLLVVTAAPFIVIWPHRLVGKTQPPACQPASFKIGIDVGHTPESPGTTSARGVPEYRFNLQLAKDIQKTLLDAEFTRTSLITVRGIGRAQLFSRAERANALGLDVLLSIHHDDVQDFYHSKWIYNGISRSFSDKFSGYSLFVSRENRSFDVSLAFAKLLGAALTARGMRYTEHHAESIRGEGRQLFDRDVGIYLYNQLLILRRSNAPAVLLEAGVIVNRVEELVLASPEGHRNISAAALDAITHFCALQQTR